MRSAPKPLHLICGGPWCCTSSTPSSGCTPSARSSSSATAPNGSPRRCRSRRPGGPTSPSSSSPCSAAPATPRSVGMIGARRRRLDDDVDDPRAARRHPAAAARDPATNSSHVHVAMRQRRHAAHQRARRPDRLRPASIREARDGRVAAHRRAARRHRPTSSTSTRSARRIYAFRRDLLGPALRQLTPDNAQGEYYLTDVVGGARRRWATASGASQAPDGRDPGRQRPLAARARRARAARPHQPALAAQRRHDARPAPDLRRRHRPARPRRHAVPGHDPAGQHRRSATAARSAPTPGSSTASVGSGGVVEHTVGRDAEIGAGATVGPYAHLPAGSVGRCGRRRPGRSTLRPSADSPRPSDGRTRRGGRHAWRRSPPSGWRSTRAAPIPTLAQEVATHLDIELGHANLVEFANGEVRPPLRRERSAAPTCSSSRATTASTAARINDSIMEQLIMIDAAYRASAKRITAVCPFYGYARQDRKAEGREPITARLVADMFKAAGAKRMVSIDLHTRPDPGLLRRPGRPPHGDAGARAVRPPARRRPR